MNTKARPGKNDTDEDGHGQDRVTGAGGRDHARSARDRVTENVTAVDEKALCEKCSVKLCNVVVETTFCNPMTVISHVALLHCKIVKCPVFNSVTWIVTQRSSDNRSVTTHMMAEHLLVSFTSCKSVSVLLFSFVLHSLCRTYVIVARSLLQLLNPSACLHFAVYILLVSVRTLFLPALFEANKEI